MTVEESQQDEPIQEKGEINKFAESVLERIKHMTPQETGPAHALKNILSEEHRQEEIVTLLQRDPALFSRYTQSVIPPEYKDHADLHFLGLIYFKNSVSSEQLPRISDFFTSHLKRSLKHIFRLRRDPLNTVFDKIPEKEKNSHLFKSGLLFESLGYSLIPASLRRHYERVYDRASYTPLIGSIKNKFLFAKEPNTPEMVEFTMIDNGLSQLVFSPTKTHMLSKKSPITSSQQFAPPHPHPA